MLTFSERTAGCDGTVDRLVLPLAVVFFIVRHLVSLLKLSAADQLLAMDENALTSIIKGDETEALALALEPISGAHPLCPGGLQYS